MMWRTLLNRLSPAGPRGRLSILILHRVLPAIDPLFPDEVHADRFDRLCAWVADGFNVLPLDQAVARLRSGNLPARALAISFDDGYADNHDIAMPILQRHGLPATVFIATGFMAGGRMWNDTIIESLRRSPLPVIDLQGTLAAPLGCLPLATLAQRRVAIEQTIKALKYLPLDEREAWVQAVAERSSATLPDDLMMGPAQIRAMHQAGMQIGAHTVSHPILARLSRQAALQEIAGSKQALEALLGAPVGLFAYPNGQPGTDYTDEHVQLVRELGFEAAVTTRKGAAHSTTDPLQIPRFCPWDQRRAAFASRMAGNLWASRP